MVLSSLELEFCRDGSTHPVIAMTSNDIVLFASFVNAERQLKAVLAFQSSEISVIKLGID